MARIRSIKPEFWQDEKLAGLPAITRLVFLGLISQADDAGRLFDNTKWLDGVLFPETDDSVRESLDLLAECGRIVRGTTASGQRAIQVVNWHHQKIDKPNLAAALPAITVPDASEMCRRYVPPKLRDAIFARDGGLCQECGTKVRRDKADRYDSGRDLAEVDHVVALADGGTNAPENLQLLCLGCNRKKAGEAVRRRNADVSAPSSRSVGDVSAPHINDLRPTTSTSDLRPEVGCADALDREVSVGAEPDCYILACHVAANEAGKNNPRTPHYEPVRFGHGSSYQTASDWYSEGIPLATAEAVIAEVGAAYVPQQGRNQQISSLGYFDKAVRAKHEAEKRKPGVALVPAGAARSVEEIRERLALVLSSVGDKAERKAARGDAMRAAAEVVFSYWVQKTQQGSRALLDANRERAIVEALSQNRGEVGELLYAIDGATSDPWHNGNNQQQEVRYQIGTLFKDRAKIEDLARRCPGYRAERPHPFVAQFKAALEGEAA